MANAIITGASKGIGYWTGRALSQRDYNVFGIARNPQSCSDDQPMCISRVDVTDDAAVRDWMTAVPQAEDGEVLVINHGILGPRGPLAQASVAEFREVMAVNANGAYSVLHAALQRPRIPRVIAVLTSSVGRMGRAGWGPYSASKFVVESIVQTLAEEVPAERSIVFAFNPGGTATDMRAQAYPDEDPGTLPTAQVIGSLLARVVDEADQGLHGASINARDLLD